MWVYISVAAFLVIGCKPSGPEVVGSGIAATEQRKLADFDSVAFVGSMDVQIVTGAPAPLEITADDNILPLIQTEVTNGHLTVGSKVGIRPKTPITLKIQAPNIKSVSGDGAVKIVAKGLQGNEISIDLTGASPVRASGKVERLRIETTGAGAVRADELAADHADVVVTGAGKIEVHAVQTLKVSMTGAGTVQYHGDPRIEKSIVGVGVIEKK
jgi:hypothetical protein